jgi:uncharacterized membrane protein
MRSARVFFSAVIFICAFETLRLWFVSPDVMASHFNLQGNPDSFVSKPVFFGFEALIVLVVMGFGVMTQILLMKLPVNSINIPNREYWLAPERRAATAERLGDFNAALFGLILLMIQVAFELAVTANLHDPIIFAGQIMVPMIIGFVLLTFLMLIWLTASFRLPA